MRTRSRCGSGISKKDHEDDGEGAVLPKAAAEGFSSHPRMAKENQVQENKDDGDLFSEDGLKAWATVADAFSDIAQWMTGDGGARAVAQRNDPEIQTAVNQLRRIGMHTVFLEWFLEMCFEHIQKKIVPKLQDICKELEEKHAKRADESDGDEKTNPKPFDHSLEGKELLEQLKGWGVEEYGQTLEEVLLVLLDAKRFVAEIASMIIEAPRAIPHRREKQSPYTPHLRRPPRPSSGTPYTPVNRASAASPSAVTNSDLIREFWHRVDAAFFTSMPKGFDIGTMALANIRFLQYQKLHKLSKSDLKSLTRGKIKGDEDDQGDGDEDDEGEESEEEESEDEQVSGMEEPELQAAMKRFMKLGESVRRMGWMRFAEKAFSRVIDARVESRLTDRCADIHDEPLLAVTMAWMDNVILPWLQMFTGSTRKVRPLPTHLLQASPLPTTISPMPTTTRSSSDDKANTAIDVSHWHQRVVLFTYQRFAAMRISEMWDVIIDFPNTKPALLDLRECLAKTGEHHLLINSLRNTFSRRLLTPGANTSDILLQYNSTIGALCVVDPTRIILKAVGPPICKYLRSRSDTVRCIVSSLIDPNDDKDPTGLAELAADLDPEGATEEQHSDDERGDPFEWEPDAILADSSKVRGVKHKSDILQMLMTIYGSNELFIKEYRLLLADLLVNIIDYDTDKQVQQLELLKIRFGESAMHACDVMLRDLANSKRINSHIQPNLKEGKKAGVVFSQQPPSTPAETPVKTGRVTRQSARQSAARQGTIAFRTRKKASAADEKAASRRKSRSRRGSKNLTPPQASSSSKTVTQPTTLEYSNKFMEASIISKEFWPNIQEGQLTLPPRVKGLADSYSEQFTKLKAPRVLKFIPSLGRVHLQVELKDRKLDMQVTAIQAACISQFEGSEELTLSEISERMGCDSEKARRALIFWLRKKVLKEVKSKDGVLSYCPLEQLSGEEDDSTISFAEEEGVDDVLQSHSKVETKIIESYIMGVVLDFKAVPLSHIKNMLKIMTSDENMRLTDRQIVDALDRMTKNGKIECKDGRYKSIKKRK